MEKVRGDQYKGELKVGQRVHSMLYGGDGFISAINGQQDPGSIKSLGGGGYVVMGGRASVDVVFEEYVSRAIPEAIIRGVQWYISNVIETPAEIEHGFTRAHMAQDAEKQKQEKEAEARKEAKKRLPNLYPYLIPATNEVRGYVLGAKNLRIELKRVFPEVKFSVRSESYSGGCSINVGWTDGPLTEDVEKISGKYQEGSFDGMTDCYNYDREDVWTDVFGGAKYVMEQRHESPELIKKVAAQMGYDLPSGGCNNGGYLADLDWEKSQMIYREARKTRS